MEESKKNDEEKNDKAITKYNNPKRNKKNRRNPIIFDYDRYFNQVPNGNKILKTVNILKKAYENRDKIKAMTEYSHLLLEDGSGYKIDQLNNYNKLTSLVVKNQDLILSVNAPKITETIKECIPHFQNIDINEEDVCWVLGGLAGLIGSVFLGEAGAVVGLVSIGILIVKGASLNDIFKSSYKILENEDMRKIILDPNKLGPTLEAFETLRNIIKREEKEEKRKKEEAKKNNTHKKIQYDDGTYYEGNVNDNDLPNGKGIIYNKNNNIRYEGDFVNGKKEGKGKLFSKHEKYYYIGEFKNGKRHGKGTEYYKNNNNIRYEGDFVNGKKEGKGKFFCEDEKSYYIGEFKNGKRHGKGTEYYKNNNISYEGDFVNGKRHGKGIEYFENGKIHYKGDFILGNYEYGEIYDDEGLFYSGQFENGYINLSKIMGNN